MAQADIVKNAWSGMGVVAVTSPPDLCSCGNACCCSERSLRRLRALLCCSFCLGYIGAAIALAVTLPAGFVLPGAVFLFVLITGVWMAFATLLKHLSRRYPTGTGGLCIQSPLAGGRWWVFAEQHRRKIHDMLREYASLLLLRALQALARDASRATPRTQWDVAFVSWPTPRASHERTVYRPVMVLTEGADESVAADRAALFDDNVARIQGQLVQLDATLSRVAAGGRSSRPAGEHLATVREVIRMDRADATDGWTRRLNRVLRDVRRFDSQGGDEEAAECAEEVPFNVHRPRRLQMPLVLTPLYAASLQVRAAPLGGVASVAAEGEVEAAGKQGGKDDARPREAEEGGDDGEEAGKAKAKAEEESDVGRAASSLV